MRLSYQWLEEVVDLEGVSPEELAEKLTNAGIAVDAVEPRVSEIKGLVVGLVVDCAPHPDADRLNVCRVDVGQEELLTIVCGAPNVAAGQRVPTALVGAKLPGGKIKKAKLRGIASEGMLCSAEEIGLEIKWLPKEQTTGLYILPEDAEIGADAVKLLCLDDTILELDLTPNRADCMSLRGLAYEVSAILERRVMFKEDVEVEQKPGPAPVTVELTTALCSRYDALAMHLEDTSKSSPLWMQMRLLAMGVRPISTVVDVTNYVMLEWGQPLHAFDLDEVHNQTIVVRQARENEQIVTLDGMTRELTADTIVISDPDRAIGVAGVMGGENSEITDGTTEIVIESAAFNAPSVRRAGQRLGLHSEAQQRFEKGIDSAAVRGALLRTQQLLEQFGTAAAVGSVVSELNTDRENASVSVGFSVDRCNQLLGTAISADDMESIFRRLRFEVQRSTPTSWHVSIPSRRKDIGIEADLIEEIGRIYGLDEIVSTLVQGATTVGVRNKAQQVRRRVQRLLSGSGMSEVLTYTFSHPDKMDALRLDEHSDLRRMIPLLRPISEERTVLRTHMLPGLAEVAAYNVARHVLGGRIFEIGRVYRPLRLPLREQPTETMQWAGLWFGQKEGANSSKGKVEHYDFFDVKGIVEAWLEDLGLLSVAAFQRGQSPWFHPGRNAEVVVEGMVVGSFGELHPETAGAFDLGTALYAEFQLDVVVEKVSLDWNVTPLPKFPSSRRDLAVVVAQEVEAGELLSAASAAVEAVLPDTLETYRVFDVYMGEHVPDGMKSVAMAFVFRAKDRTLTDEEVDEAVQSVLEVWNREYHAHLRT
ncbi:phenylalanine--tRNA ligase subunit beta [Alicyclobacillus sp. SO9]|uniref:phenylalanine--tRNA ligase subunit beta n=1 Tax=Alicyclobacillus sp. SO9 TaxID=2665646 RepID=UPI0018E8C825|nr:phenylalanine--tRNA ligase subunit beta [Alicyclobacillus sp. SO9]QQE77475.1 phenylalanine--tRNA ligase subunit beta [Alicyclobacillus sp. SO9]